MIIQPEANNAISIRVNNGDVFHVHSPNEKEIVISRPQKDNRNYEIAGASEYDGTWLHLASSWMIRITKAEVSK